MQKHDEACQQVKRVKAEKIAMESEWKVKWEKSQMELNQTKDKCNRLAQDNERLLSVIATLKKPVKRKPLPPTKVVSLLSELK